MLKDFFYLQKNDQQAILTLLGIILTCTCIIFLIGKNEEKRALSTTVEDSTATNPIPQKGQSHLYYKVEGKMHELFIFDPNTADSTDFLKLGLQPWQVRSIYRYRAKGGIYRTATDFAKLFGLTKKQYETLAPYIHIADDYRPASDFYGDYKHRKRHYQEEKYNNSYTNRQPTAIGKDNHEEKVFSYPHKLKMGQQVSINSADSTELMKIPGIGGYYAKKIIRYREQLGGFVSPSQLSDIEGIPESVLPYIHIETNEIKKLNVNQLTLSQMRKHPYINFYQAKAICDYRRLRGPLKGLEDLKLLKDFPPAEIERLRPYVCF